MKKYEFRGMELVFEDTGAIAELAKEILADNYRVFDMDIGAGDVILDIGANEGVFSIAMAKLFPEARILSYEPVPATFYTMLTNIKSNGIYTIEAHNLGLAEERGWYTVVCNNTHSGGASGVQTVYDAGRNHRIAVRVCSLDEVLINLPRVKLMKIDVEGMEYEILEACTMLDRVERIVGEFHINPSLEGQGRSIDGLAAYLRGKTDLHYFERCRMAD